MVTSPCWQEAVDWAVTPSNSSPWNRAGTLWGATGSYNLNLTLFRALSWELPQQAPRRGVRQPSWREAENLPAYRYVTPHHHTASRENGRPYHTRGFTGMGGRMHAGRTDRCHSAGQHGKHFLWWGKCYHRLLTSEDTDIKTHGFIPSAQILQLRETGT